MTAHPDGGQLPRETPGPPAHATAAGARRIVVMAKTPVAGRVKTRLEPTLGAHGAAELAAAMLGDTVDNALAVGDEVVVATAGSVTDMRSLVDPRAELRRQRGESLAERLLHAQAEAFDGGAAAVLLLGADCPTADPDVLDAGFAALARATVAIGPANDGGYVLLAARRPTPELFEGIVMGRADVAERTAAAAAAAEISLVMLPMCVDIDLPGDLLTAQRAGQLASAPRTTALLSRLLARP